jgi:amino acid transporter
MFGGRFAGNVMAVLVIISGLGALNGWTMICAEMPLAAAKDGLFPERFRRLSKAGVPAFGIVSSATLASVAMLINHLGSGGASAFTTLVLMTGITAAIPYSFSALAQIKYRCSDHRAIETPRFIRDLVVALVALVFSVLFIWYSRNTSAQGGRSIGEIFGRGGLGVGTSGRVGAVPARRRRAAARHPGLQGAAPQDGGPGAWCRHTADACVGAIMQAHVRAPMRRGEARWQR